MLRAALARSATKVPRLLGWRALSDEIDVLADHRRKLVFGNHAVHFDEHPYHLDGHHRTSLDLLRKKAEDALVTRSRGDLEAAAVDAIHWMEQLPKEHQLYVNKRFNFVTYPSPLSRPLLSGLCKVFLKVADLRSNGVGRLPGYTQTPYKPAQPCNASSMALEGVRGLGKSNLLRLLTLVPVVLFPESVVSVYVDYSAVHQHAPSRLLAAGLKAVTHKDVDSPDSLEHVLDAVTTSQRVAVFAADELESVYLNSDVWANFHMLVDDYSSTLFVAGGSKVRAMVERRGHEEQLRRWFPGHAELPHSLNQDKLEVVHIACLSTEEQYRAFLRDNHNAAATKQRILGLHARTGGRLRALSLPASETRVCLPGPGQAARAVLENLYALQASLGSDPFKPVAVSGNTIRQWLDDYRKTCSGAVGVDLHSLLDDNYLTKTADGYYTFAFFDYYWQLRAATPPGHHGEQYGVYGWFD